MQRVRLDVTTADVLAKSVLTKDHAGGGAWERLRCWPLERDCRLSTHLMSPTPTCKGTVASHGSRLDDSTVSSRSSLAEAMSRRMRAKRLVWRKLSTATH
jgi:hypothetical protein